MKNNKKIKLEHVGTFEDDFLFFQLDSKLYYELQKRGYTIMETAFKNFMGNFYKEPLPTKKELEEKLQRYLQRIRNLKEMKTPKELFADLEEIASELYFKIQNKQYAKAKDPVYKIYKKQRDLKTKQWFSSEEFINLTNEIYEYNKKQFEKISEEKQILRN